MPSKREQLKESISARILSEAFEEFAEKGYTKTKLSDISQRAEVATGLVNKYFESKEKLFFELIERRVFSDIFRSDENCTLDEALDSFLDEIKQSICADRTKAQFDRMLVSSTDLPFEMLDIFPSIHAAEPLLNMIAQAQKRGDIPTSETPAGLLFALYKGTVIICRWYRELGLPMPENDSLLFIIAYDRAAISEGRPTYFQLHKK